MIVAEQDYGIDPKRIAESQPGLPIGYARHPLGVAIYDKTAVHWKTKAAEAMPERDDMAALFR